MEAISVDSSVAANEEANQVVRSSVETVGLSAQSQFAMLGKTDRVQLLRMELHLSLCGDHLMAETCQ